jgi:hypothetical protein
MTPADRQKLKDAFTKAVNNSPYADETIEGLVKNDGQPLTRRELVEGTLKMEEFYAEVDKMLSHGKVTLDQFIGKFEDGMKKSIYKP